MQDSTLGIYNVGCCLEDGIGVKANLDKEKASVYQKVFEKEGFRLFIEDCIEDELQGGAAAEQTRGQELKQGTGR